MILTAPAAHTHAPTVTWQAMGASEHFVQFYEADTFLLDAVAAFVADGLEAGEGALVVATAAHRAGLEERLLARGLDVSAAAAENRYVARDAAETLAHFMVAGAPDPERFAAVVGEVLAQAAQGGRRVRVFGEMVALLAAAGNHAAALRLEHLWNDLRQTQDFALYCAYPMASLGDEARGAIFDHVCATHSGVIPAESYAALDTADERLRAIAVLQQRARCLEAEIAERQRAEAALREQTRIVETINRVGQALVAELDQEQLVQAITDAATEVTGAQFGALFYNVLNEQGESYTLYTLSGAPREAFEGFPMPRNTAIFEPTFRGTGVVRLADATQDPRYGQNPPYHGMPPGRLPVRSYLAAPIVSRSGEVLGGLFFGHAEPGVFTERAERLLIGIAAQAAIALDNARLYRNAQQAVRLRDEFLAAASHDLKTPLTSVKGLAQLLQRRTRQAHSLDADALLAGLQRIDAAATRMTGLVDTLLDVTRVQMGQPLALDRRPTDLVALARQVLDEQQHTTDRHSLRLDTDAPALVGAWDASRLGRVLGNLLNNAIKYSPAGGEITVALHEETAPDGRWAVVVVRDQGLGIPAPDLARIFERFQRARNVPEQISGTGIGLAASRQIVEEHGGQIAVESREGRGTSFTIRLPVAAAVAGAAPSPC
jgi:signal transduction histidine kinase